MADCSHALSSIYVGRSYRYEIEDRSRVSLPFFFVATGRHVLHCEDLNVKLNQNPKNPA